MMSRNAALAARLRLVRHDLFGEDGASAMAYALSLPEHTWKNYEVGVVLPAVVLLAFIECTGTNPHWLLTGEGQQYQTLSTVRR